MIRILAGLTLFAFLTGGVTAKPFEKIPKTRSVAVISAFAPIMSGVNPGLFKTAFWLAENPGFDINAAVLEAVKVDVNREVKLMKGGELGLSFLKEKPEPGAANKTVAELKNDAHLLETQLQQLGEQWQVDVIMLISTGAAPDWIGRSGDVLAGYGFYRRPMVCAAFWVPLVGVFDCHTGHFIGEGSYLDAQRLPDIAWRDSWKECSPGEKRAVIEGLEALVRISITPYLVQAGLSDKQVPVPDRTWASRLGVPGADAREYSSTGNQFEIPPGLPLPLAHRAVLAAFKDEEWIVTSNTGEIVVGVYRDKSHEAICTVTFKDRAIILTPEGYKIDRDGRREPAEYRRQQENLRKAVFNNVTAAQAVARPDMLPGNQFEIPPGISVPAARGAVLAAFKDREWSVTADTDGLVVGVHRDKSREAVCTVRFKDRMIVLTPEGYKIDSTGKRVPVEYPRWQNNLKESIFEELMKVAPEGGP